MAPATDHPAAAPGLVDWHLPAPLGDQVVQGRYVRLEPLDPGRHAPAVFGAVRDHPALWDYMGNGPYDDPGALGDWMRQMVAGEDGFMAFVAPDSGRAFGYGAFMRIDRRNGVVEIGNIMIGAGAQRGQMSSEALMTMIAQAFAAGFRRVEWKCNALNLASRRAARRYGFAFEGLFRQHMIVKGRNRDTAWFSMTDADWPDLAPAHAAWLDPANFDAHGRQRRSLSSLTAPMVARAEAAIAVASAAGP
ncbi:MAG: GNAT family protein [Paracoccus sp. (in: a-proteobacteria)]|nr:GNAT family protein [Paracoccus sp. (in: a-proteobacteria)]